MIAAIIPARGGSKRLPRKNVLPFAGRPLVAWSVAAGLAAPSVGGVWVTTEDAEIASVARTCGAGVIDRPIALAGDESSMLDVLCHGLAAIRAEGHQVEAVLLLQPTNPLRPVAVIEDAVAAFRATPCDSVITVSRRALKTGRLDGVWYQPSYAIGQQSRLTEPLIYENGLVYITRAANLDSGSLLGARIQGFIAPRPYDEVDIDEPDDLFLGEAIAAVVRDRLGY